MRAALLAGAMMAIAIWDPSAHAATPLWHVTKTEWTDADEKGFGDFVRGIAESDCSTTIECLKGPANPYRDSDPEQLAFIADCADFPYMLRAYYAWKNGLPFTYINEISGAGADIRFSHGANRPLARRNIGDNGAGVNALDVLTDIHMHVSSATYRMDAAAEDGSKLDFYSPKIRPGAIHPGTVIYDINGHVTTVYKIDPDGRVYYVDASPDHLVTRHMYGAQFGQSQAELGGGFKNWRPITLVGARKASDGNLIGGHIVLAPNAEIDDFSLEQYQGNVPGETADGVGAFFQYNTVPLSLYEYVRVSLSGGKMNFNPVYQLRESIATLCGEVKDRVQAVDQATADRIDAKPQPAHLPNNIYGSDSDEWETYATPARDAQLRYDFGQAYQDLRTMIMLWQERDKRIAYDGISLKQDLQQAYADEAKQCQLTYINSDGAPVTLGYDEIVHRLFAMDFDPYHCVERRWGATGAELSSCKDDATKARWYAGEQRLRNQVERNDDHMGFSLDQLENHANGTGPEDPPPLDVKALIDGIGYQIAYQPMKPVGF